MREQLVSGEFRIIVECTQRNAYEANNLRELCVSTPFVHRPEQPDCLDGDVGKWCRVALEYEGIRKIMDFCLEKVLLADLGFFRKNRCYIGSFNRDARHLLDYSSHVTKVTSINCVVNCLIVYGESPWKVIVLINV